MTRIWFSGIDSGAVKPESEIKLDGNITELDFKSVSKGDSFQLQMKIPKSTIAEARKESGHMIADIKSDDDFLPIWFRGFSLREICDKCLKNKTKYLYHGMPPSNPEVVVFVCEECLKTLDDRFDKNFREVRIKLKEEMGK